MAIAPPWRANEEDVEQYQKRGDREALHRLIVNNEPLIAYIAKEFVSPREWQYLGDDLLQRGRMTVVWCADNFDSSRQCYFSTLLGFCLRKQFASAAQVHRRHRSRFVPLTPDIEVEDGFSAFDVLDARESVRKLCRNVPYRSRYILRDVCGYGLSGEEVGRAHRITQGRVGQLLYKALLTCRAAAGERNNFRQWGDLYRYRGAKPQRGRPHRAVRIKPEKELPEVCPLFSIENRGLFFSHSRVDSSNGLHSASGRLPRHHRRTRRYGGLPERQLRARCVRSV